MRRPRRVEEVRGASFPEVQVPAHVHADLDAASAVFAIEGFLLRVHGPAPTYDDREAWTAHYAATRGRALHMIDEGLQTA